MSDSGQEPQEELQGQEPESANGERVGESAGVESVEALPEWAQKLIKDTREEAAERRVALNEALKQMEGLKSAEEVEATVGELKARVEEADRRVKVAENRSTLRGEFSDLPGEAFELIPDGELDEMRATAQKLRGMLVKPRGQRLERPGGGVSGEQGEPAFDPAEYVKRIPRR
ncbi:hypothetical protein [Schaalia sp. ZJ1691]|uniref:hypothetical protein n=1 Tax=Schaalia sp. ZJ1691 TaxID=2709404 RepID=UPI0013EBF9C5|nr:hypothetical protein [Schaalia sp. ZJ1691]